MSKKTYILSEIADKDLEDIFDYTLNEFGFNQAETYLLEIEEIFQNLFLNPHFTINNSKKREALFETAEKNINPKI